MLRTDRSGALSFAVCFFFFNDTATTEIYTLSLHDALPIFHFGRDGLRMRRMPASWGKRLDRKSTRLNSSHLGISYAVFCLKKKKNISRRSETCLPAIHPSNTRPHKIS